MAEPQHGVCARHPPTIDTVVCRVNGFGVPEIMMLTELLLRAPQLLDDTLVSVDLLKDSAEGEEVTLPSV